MTSSAALPCEPTPLDLARQTHAFLVSLDPATWKAEAASKAEERLTQLHACAEGLVAAWEGVPPLSATEERVRATVHALWNELPAPLQVASSEWQAVRTRLEPFYESLANALRKDGETVDRLHPTNYMRNLLHIGAGVAVAIAYETILTPSTAIAAAGAFVVWAWSCEISRYFFPRWNRILMWVFGPFARPHEHHRVNSGTWFGTALLVLTLTAQGFPGILGVLALGVGDPAAAHFGRRWGRTRIRGSRSLEGALAFAATTALACLAYLSFFHGEIPFTAALLFSVAADVVGAIAEAFAGRLEDNVTIPLSVAWSILALQAMMGM